MIGLYHQNDLRRAWSKNNGLLVCVFVFSVFANLLVLTGPLFMLQIYDRVLSSRSHETLVALLILVCLLYAIFSLLDYARARLLTRIGARFQNQLDKTVFTASLTQPTDAPNGLRDLTQIRRLLSSPAIIAFCDLPWAPLFIAVIFVFHPVMGWFALGAGCALIFVSIVHNFISRRRISFAQNQQDRADRLAHDARIHAQIIQSQGMTNQMQSRWEVLRKNALTSFILSADINVGFTSFTKGFRMLMQSVMLALGAYLTLQGQMTAGAMIAGSILLGRALAPIEQTLSQWPQFQSSIQAWRSLDQLMQKDETTPDLPKLPVPKPELKLSDFTVLAEKTRKPILGNINLTLEGGQAVGIVGKSGSGKSSLAKSIMSLIKPTGGDIRLGGVRLEQYRGDDLGTYLGYLPQEVSLLNASVAENIARMDDAPDMRRVVRAAKQANAHDLIVNLSAGYKTQISQGDGLLSGGQRQRIALARALYSNPILLVLDEPNSALDGDGTEALNRTVSEFKADGKMVVIMTHRPMAISQCDRLIVLEDGYIKADGPRDEIIKSMMRNADQISHVFDQQKKASS